MRLKMTMKIFCSTVSLAILEQIFQLLNLNNFFFHIIIPKVLIFSEVQSDGHIKLVYKV